MTTDAQNTQVRLDSPIQFAMAGNAIFTVRSVKTGVRYTYRVKQADPKPGQTETPYFVSLLAGPDNTADYQYIGMIRDGRFATTRASKLPANSAPCVAFGWFIAHPTIGVEVYHAGRCGRCARVLTVPESIASGYGPECSGKLAMAA